MTEVLGLQFQNQFIAATQIPVMQALVLAQDITMAVLLALILAPRLIGSQSQSMLIQVIL